ncbi:MAG TPA: DUF4198 domain-containing protein [Thermoanaerobaculia bacterium]|jgi:uncharacterized GH25 family protein
MFLRVLLIALFAGNAAAHDFWIEPSTYRPTAGKSFSATLRVGEQFEGDPVPRRSARIESFVVRTASGEQPVNGFENQSPAGFVRIDEAGTAVIGYRGKPTPHELPTAKFMQFLTEEGIKGLKPKGARQRERFYRFAKSLVQIGDRQTETTPFGWRFELIPHNGRFQLLFEGKPLKGALVSAITPNGKRLDARTDANGTVAFNLDKGVWLIKTVHVLPAPANSDFDWESLWASVTLER